MVLDNSFENELTFEKIQKILIRKRFFIAKFAGLGILLSVVYSLIQKPTWEGEFQIVLTKSQNSLAAMQANLLPDIEKTPFLSLSGLKSSNEELKTQVAILKSPSVLLPIYDFVKKEKELAGKKVKYQKYQEWLDENFEIDLKRGTSVLNIIYRSKDKELIKPVLAKVSKAYEYSSGKKRNRDIELSLNYLNEQVDLYKKKSLNSIKELQKFSIKHDIPITNKKSSNLESIRIASANKIRNLDEIKNNLDNISNDLEKLRYVSNIPDLNSDEGNLLDRIDIELVNLKSKFKENDRSIVLLQDKRRDLIYFLKNKAYKNLEMLRSNAEAKMKAATRPENVILKFRELARDASRDENTLNNLEATLRTTSLEKSRILDPWELITRPTLYKDPVAPRKKRIVSLAFLISLILSSFYVVLTEQRKKLIFDSTDLLKRLDLKKLALLGKNYNEWDETISLLIKGPLSIINDEKIGIITVGNIEIKDLDVFCGKLKERFNEENIVISRNLLDTKNCKTQIILITLGGVTEKEILNLNFNLKLQGGNTAGIIFISEKDQI